MNCNAITSVLLVLLITGITLLGSCGFVTAEETSSSTGSPDVQVVPLSGTIIPVDDGKEIHWVEEGSPLEIWWQKTIVGFISFFQGTILENVVLILIPIVSALLGVLCIGIFTSANKRIKSPVSENILLSIRENPGITQKQITDTVRCSRGSVCYHLHQLEKTGKIRKLHLGTTPQYYPSAELPSPDTLLEQTILLLLSRKKSGKFLRTLYENPCITQKRTCRTPQHPSDNRPLVPSHLHQKPHTLRRTKRPGTPLLPHPRSRNNLHPPHTRHPKPLNQKKRKNKKRITHDPQSAVPSQNNQPSSYPHGKYLPYGTRPQEPTQPQPPPHPPQPRATTNTAEASPSTKS